VPCDKYSFSLPSKLRTFDGFGVYKSFEIPVSDSLVPPEYTTLLDEIDRLADRLDCQFRVPLTSFRFGWDPIAGVLPIVGDVAMAIVAYRIVQAADRLGADRSILRRMKQNVLIDLSFGLIPFAGVILDAAFKANLRNVALLMDEIRRRRLQPSQPENERGAD
jgi:hypothetical protein